MKKRKSVNSNEIFTSDILVIEKSETTPDFVTSMGKKLKKESPEEFQELQSPLGNISTPRSFTNMQNSFLMFSRIIASYYIVLLLLR